ncbi:MAG: lipopolysaccharide/colanic/teichoic acid biosynthesis glycosyltransferase [Pseudohongiellaceae bacterium]|jgi:lipopolysaccharide/colanic/teichoic acid biosynthesis glycosyltransferase
MALSTKGARRALDVSVSLVGLCLMVMALPFVALAIKLDSRGPLFARDLRVGQQRRDRDRTTGGQRLHDARGHLFWSLRFRVLGEDVLTKGRRLGEDPRLTRVGRVLRRTGLEDWPQLWIVLRGRMSLVGPRPLTPDCIDRLCREFPAYRSRLSDMMPGLLGFAQTECAESANFFAAVCEKIVFDLHYRNRLTEVSPGKAVLQDLKVMAATVLGRWRGSRRVVGTDVISVEYPHAFGLLGCDPSALARRMPAELSGEVVEHDAGFTCWWYPPHRPVLGLSVPQDELMSEICETLAAEAGGALCFAKSLQPGESAPAGEEPDCISAELPSALEDVQAVSEHFVDLWQELASRSSDEHFVFSMSFLLIEGLVTVASSADEDHGRLRIEVEIYSDRVQLRVLAIASERSSTPRYAPAVALPRLTS